MGTLPHIEYVGFTTRGSAREYTLRVRRPSGDAFFVLSIPTEAFDARRVRYQDGAEICFLRLQRELPALADSAGELMSLYTTAKLFRSSTSPTGAM